MIKILESAFENYPQVLKSEQGIDLFSDFVSIKYPNSTTDNKYLYQVADMLKRALDFYESFTFEDINEINNNSKYSPNYFDTVSIVSNNNVQNRSVRYNRNYKDTIKEIGYILKRSGIPFEFGKEYDFGNDYSYYYRYKNEKKIDSDILKISFSVYITDDEDNSNNPEDFCKVSFLVIIELYSPNYSKNKQSKSSTKISSSKIYWENINEFDDLFEFSEDSDQAISNIRNKMRSRNIYLTDTEGRLSSTFDDYDQIEDIFDSLYDICTETIFDDGRYIVKTTKDGKLGYMDDNEESNPTILSTRKLSVNQLLSLLGL